MELSNILATEYLPRYIASHDCVDTGTAFSITGGAAPVKLTIDGLNRNKYNIKELFKNSNVKDSIVWSAIISEFNMKVTAANFSIFKISIVIPHPTLDDIPVAQPEFLIFKASIPQDIVYTKLLPQADDGEAHLYGFDVYVSCDNDAEITSRSVISVML